jgi:hypothetical protein
MRRNALRLTVSAAVASVVALTLVVVALADKEQVRLTAADQAFARAAVLTKADLGTVGSWTGGAVKPDLTSSPPCTSFHPKQSDLVLTGAAETRFKEPGIEIDSEAQVLQTAQMVALDWQRVVASPQLLPCLRVGLAKQVGASTRIVSLRRIAFPRIGQRAAAIRVLLDVKAGASPVPVRAFVDVAFVAEGRTELTLTTTALLAADGAVRPAEARLARTLAARAHA